MADDFDEIADAFEEAADAIEDAFDGEELEPEEEVVDTPDVPDVSVDVPGDEDFTYPTIRNIADDVDEALNLMEDSIGEGILRDSEFWDRFTEQLDVEVDTERLESPLAESEDGGVLPTEVIEGINPTTVVEPTPGEGEVSAVSDPEEVGKPSPDAFREALLSIREVDTKLDRIQEAHNDLRGSKETIEDRLLELKDDRETLQQAIEQGDGDVEKMNEVMADIDTQIEGGLDLIEEAEKKMGVLAERGDRLRQDRNEYRSEVNAYYVAAQNHENDLYLNKLQETYRGHRIRSGSDVPFRPDAIRHVFSAMHTRQSRGDMWVDLSWLQHRMADVWGHDEDEAGRAVQVLLTTGELERRENQVRLSPLTE